MANNRPAGVDYCTVHHGIRNEDADVCDFAEDDQVPTADGEPRPCVLRECFYTTRPRKRSKREVEDRPYIAMVARLIRAAGRRAGAADPDTIAVLLKLKELVDQVAADAMVTLHDSGDGFSWPEIAAAVGKDARAVQRWAARHATICHGHHDHDESAESRFVA